MVTSGWRNLAPAAVIDECRTALRGLPDAMATSDPSAMKEVVMKCFRPLLLAVILGVFFSGLTVPAAQAGTIQAASAADLSFGSLLGGWVGAWLWGHDATTGRTGAAAARAAASAAPVRSAPAVNSVAVPQASALRPAPGGSMPRGEGRLHAVGAAPPRLRPLCTGPTEPNGECG